MILSWWANVLIVLMPMGSAGGQADEAERRQLRARLATFSPEVPLDLEAEPWRGVQQRGDFVQNLIAEAESAPQPGETPDTVTSIGRATVTVLKEYGKTYPGTGVDDYLRRVAIDQSKPIPLRLDATRALGETIAPRTTPFYVEVFNGYPELTTPLVSILNNLAKEGSPLGNMRDLYTRELSQAMVAYYARRAADPKVDPKQLEWGKRLVARLDQLMAETPPKGETPKSISPPRDPPSPTPRPPAPKPDGDRPTPDEPGGSSRRSFVAGLAVAVLTVGILLWAILKKKARGGRSAL